MNLKVLVVAMAKLGYWHLVSFVAQRLPISLLYSMSSRFVSLFIFVFRRKCEEIAQGVNIMYSGKSSPEKTQQVVHKTIDNNLKNTMEHVIYPKFNLAFCDKHIDYYGLENLDEALKQKKGVVLLHGHSGNPHIIMPAIGSKGYRLHQLASRNPPDLVHGFGSRLVNKIRYKNYERSIFLKETFPVNFIYVDKFLRETFAVLKRNEILSMAIDGREGDKYIRINFLNQKALFFTGVMRIILKMNPVVLPIFHHRSQENKHSITIYPALEIIQTGNKEKDLRTNIKKFTEILEKHVRKYPGSYAEAFTIKPFFEGRA